MSTGQYNAPSAPFSRWNYFVACCSRSELVYRLLRSVAGQIHFLKALVLKLCKKIWGWLFPKVKKRALLIGIRHDDDPITPPLTGPHRDVDSLKQLLIDVYGYKDADIVVMLDGARADPNLAPTRENMLREIRKLVEDAKSGDHFTFHFSGHSTQIMNKTGSEEDGWDEVLITMDDKYLIDNLLRKCLVDRLPIGSTLVAIFDTCHSGSLLDLPHYRCNRVYVPWLSRGKSSMPVYYREQISTNNMASRNTSRYTDPPVSQLSNSSSINSPSPHMGTIREEPDVEDDILLGSRCASPTPTVKCDGFGLCNNLSTEFAHVIALGACKDAQNAWEDVHGHSVTAVLVEFLSEPYLPSALDDFDISWLSEQEPYPRLNDLMRALSHRTYETVCRLHTAWQDWEAERKREGRENRPARTPEEEEENRHYMMMKLSDPLNRFQDPQLASHIKLDMNMTFTF